MNFYKIRIGIACALITCISAEAQVKDAGLWANVNIEKNITQRFAANFNQEFRFNENVSELGSFFSELGLAFKIKPNLSISANYRYINRRQLNDMYVTRSRYYTDLNFKPRIKKFTLGLRARFQSQYDKDIFTTEELLIPSNYVRGRVSLKYNTEKRWKPFLAAETWYSLNNPKGNNVDNYRFSGGFDYELNKYSSLQLSYLHNREINVRRPNYDYITAISYNLTF